MIENTWKPVGVYGSDRNSINRWLRDKLREQMELPVGAVTNPEPSNALFSLQQISEEMGIDLEEIRGQVAREGWEYFKSLPSDYSKHNGLPYGAVRKCPGSIVVAVLFDQRENRKCWRKMMSRTGR